MNLFDVLIASEKSNQLSLDQQGRVSYPCLGVVVNNNDPENKRKVKVVTQDKAQVESDWIRRLLIYPGFDPPVPTVGQTVLVFYADGLEDNAYYLQIVNDTNPPLDKNSPLSDLSLNLEGDRTENITGSDIKNIDGSFTVSAGSVETISDTDISNSCDGDFNVDTQAAIVMQALQTLTLFAGQYLKLQAGPTNYIELGSDGTSNISGNWVINLAGSSLSFINASSISINGAQVAVVGATNSDGSTVVTKGW